MSLYRTIEDEPISSVLDAMDTFRPCGPAGGLSPDSWRILQTRRLADFLLRVLVNINELDPDRRRALSIALASLLQESLFDMIEGVLEGLRE